MKKLHFKLITCITFLFTSISAYFILLENNPLHLSIAEIIRTANTLDIDEHLIVLGILPIYIALVIFGAAMLGLYIGKMLSRCIISLSK